MHVACLVHFSIQLNLVRLHDLLDCGANVAQPHIDARFANACGQVATGVALWSVLNLPHVYMISTISHREREPVV